VPLKFGGLLILLAASVVAGSEADGPPLFRQPTLVRQKSELMTMRPSIRFAEIVLVVALLAAIFVSWRADRRDRAQLATQLAAAQQTIAAAADRQKDRDAQLTQTLAQIAAERKSALTPEQILQALPQALGLPAPLSMQPVARPFRGEVSSSGGTSESNVGARFIAPSADTASTNSPQARNMQPSVASGSAELPNNPTPKPAAAPDATLPSADLKPLYDFALDCQACRAKLAAAQNDLADEKTKSASLAQERDAAVRAAKGGNALRRIVRAAKWFLIGAAAGAIASKAAH